MNLCIDKSKMMLEKTSLTIQPHLPLVYNIPLAGMFLQAIQYNFSKMYLIHNGLLFTDSILQYLWLQQQEKPINQRKFQTFNDIIEAVKLTPCKLSNNLNLRRTLQHMSWILNVNINVIGFRSSKQYYKCFHTAQCYFPYYIFQNTLVKLLRSPHLLPPLIIYYYKKKYFISSQNVSTACLIDIQLYQTASHILSNEKIIDILNNTDINLSFNVILYSTYSWALHNNKNILNNNIVGCYFSKDNTNIVQIFISPHTLNNEFCAYLLEPFNTPQYLLNNNSKFAIPHLIEQDKTNIIKKNKEEMLNQNYCICEHPETQRIFFPNKTCYNIGKINNFNIFI